MTAAGLQVASLYGVIDLVDKLTPGLNKAKGSLSSFASNLGQQLTQTGAVLTAGLTLPIVGFLGASVKAFSDSQNALAQLDAVLKSTTISNGTFSDATSGTSKEITKLTKEVDTATTHVETLQKKWDTSTKHTQAQADALALAKQKLSDLEGQLNSATAVTQTSNDVVHMSRQAYIDLAKAMANTTRFTKDTVLSTENLLLTFTAIGKDVFPDATKTVLDMAQALGEDTKSASIQLGKALQDPIHGVTALKRVGVQFTDAQKNQIETLVKSGKIMQAQKMILQELQKEFGGSAVAAGQTFAGQMDILNHHFTDFQEKVGGIVVPMLEKFMVYINNLVDGLNNLNPNILQMGIVAAIAAAAIGPVLGILGAIATVIGFVLSPIGLLVAAVGALALAFATNFGGIRDIVTTALGYFEGAFREIVGAVQTFVNDLFNGKGDIGERFKKAISDALPKLLQGFQDILFAAETLIGDYWPKVVKAFETLLGKVGDWLSSGGLGKLVIGLGDMMGKAANWFITDGAPALLKGVQGLFKAIQDFIGSDGFKKFAAGLLEVIRQAGDWVISTGWPLLKKSIDALVQLIVTALKPITQGIVDAITKGVYDAYNAVAALTGQPQVHQMPSGWKPPTGGGIGGGVNIGMAGFAAGGPVGPRPQMAMIGHGNEYVVPEGGALVSRGGGPSVIQVNLIAEGFKESILIDVADAMRAGRAAG